MGCQGKARLASLQGHTGAVTSVAVTPDGARIVTGSGTAQPGCGTPRLALSCSGSRATPDGSLSVAVSAGRGAHRHRLIDNTARVWDAETGAELAAAQGPHRHRHERGGDAGRGAHRHRLSDKTARVWDAETGAELLQLKGHAGTVKSVAVTPDGARIVTGSADNTARVWDAKTGAELLQLKGHTGGVTSVAVSAGRGAHRHRLRRQDGAGVGRETGRSCQAQGPRRHRLERGGDAGRGSHRHRLVLTRTARVWDAETGAELAQLKGHIGSRQRAWRLARTGPASSPARTTGRRGYGTRHRPELAQLKGHTGFVSGVAVTPDGARIVTGSDDKTARVWDAGPAARAVPAQGPHRPRRRAWR